MGFIFAQGNFGEEDHIAKNTKNNLHTKMSTFTVFAIANSGIFNYQDLA